MKWELILIGALIAATLVSAGGAIYSFIGQ